MARLGEDLARTRSRGRAGMSPRLTLLLALAGTALLRLVFVLAEPAVIYSDLLAFDEIGQAMARGDFGDLSKPPLYGMMLGAVYRMAGHSYLAVALLQVAMSVATAWLIFGYARRLHGERIALVAVGLYAVYPDLVVYPGMLLAETLFILLLVSGMTLLLPRERRSVAATAGAGVALGLATLARATTQYFPLFVIGYLLWDERSSLRRRLLLAVVFLAAFVAPIAPWAAHASSVAGRFVPVYADSWHLVWIGNNADADGTYAELPPRFAALDLGQRDSVAKAEAVAFVREQPGRALALALKKVAIFWSPKPDSGAAAYLGQMTGTAVAYVLLGGMFFFIFPLAAYGLALTIDWRRHVPFLLLAAYFTAIHAASHVGMRYRLPLVPFLLGYAAVGLAALVDRQRGVRPAPPPVNRWALAAGLALFVVSAVQFFAERASLIRAVLQ